MLYTPIVRPLVSVAFAIIIVLTASVRPAPAQDPPKIKPSQHGSVSQRIADTTIAIEYNRPVARGRDLFGALVPYGKVWCPCADDATTIEVSYPYTFSFLGPVIDLLNGDGEIAGSLTLTSTSTMRNE